MPRLKSSWTLTTLLGIALLLGVSYAGAAAAAAAADPVPVQARPLADLLIRPEASAPATVQSLGDSRISAELSARIQAIPPRVGDVVDAGGVLAQLDCGDYELSAEELSARLAGVKARLDFARQQVQRARSLARQNTMSRELREQRESELAALAAERDATDASLAMARRRVEQCTVQAPFRATVLERLASVGEYATPGQSLLRVLDLNNREVSAQVLAGDAAGLQQARRLVFRHDGRDYPLELRTLVPAIDPLTRTREARLLFSDQAAPPGASGRLVWQNGSALPSDLILRRRDALGVMLARDGAARFHPLPGAQEGRPAAVDLPEDSLVITEGRLGLEDGDPVSVAE